MSRDLIQPDSFSYEEILSDLTHQLEEKYADTDGAWRDFYQFGSGQIILELLSSLGAFTTYSALANRREAYLSETNLASSARAIAGPLGYSAFRGSNAKLTLSVHPNALTTIKKFDKVGEYDDDKGVYDLLALDDYTITAPTSAHSAPERIEVVIGHLNTTSIILPSSASQIFRFTQEKISEHFQLKLNGQVVPHSEDVIDLIEGKYVCITNAVGSVDVMAMNQYLDSENQFRAGYELEAHYVQLNDHARIQSNNVRLDIGTIEDLVISSRYNPPDTAQDIQVKAPLRHETGRVIRGRDDYMKRVREKLPGVLDVKAKDLDSATQMIAYILDSKSPLSDHESSNLIDNISNVIHRPMGVKPPTLISGTIKEVLLEVHIILKDNVTLPPSITEDALSALQQFENKLGLRIDQYDLESALSNTLHYAKAIRIKALPPADTSAHDLTQWQALNLLWNEYFEFQPRVSLLDSDNALDEIAKPAQP
ncbi:hypothetical protein CWB96_00395 [Pseudoalteromonas citrea]|uniref:Uncharacterized protein n=1 Tax=Pseudoalteromonas citrea TaxID=43655 RepID=A0A5S3XXB9_9GAMM|nr:hypothetical protein [Pseudoalteromonas citrea]TMP46326.1 hypothetical protein CWB97_02390 [Pseudoalteromonas citrea]TMP63102.1 hypothetical protein CWB96_00395 [Pseudoalteromonas citrea]